MKRVTLATAVMFCTGLALANPFGAGSKPAPQTRPVGAAPGGPITDSPPPPPRSDLGPIVESTITLTPTTPHVEGRTSLRVIWDGDAGGWPSNPSASITTPMISSGAAYYTRAGKSLTWPPFPVDSGLPKELRKQVISLLAPSSTRRS